MRQGRFELADGGTIFLDEIGDLAPELQAKLLRVLQEGEFERVGSSKTRRVDVRRDCRDARRSRKGGRRGAVPRRPLLPAQRVSDHAAAAARAARGHPAARVVLHSSPPAHPGAPDRPRFPPASCTRCSEHDWPGNVRELENVIERAMIRSSNGTLQLNDPLRAVRRVTAATATAATRLDAVQRAHIERVLRECGWRINGAGNAAVRLGIHPNTLRFRIKKLGVAIPWQRARAPKTEARVIS